MNHLPKAPVTTGTRLTGLHWLSDRRPTLGDMDSSTSPVPALFYVLLFRLRAIPLTAN